MNMKKDIVKHNSWNLTPDVRNFYNGENGIQIAHADNFKPTINIILPNAGQAHSSSLNTDYYNLLIGYDPFESDHVIVDRSRALTEHMAPEVSARFCGWTDEQLAEIKKLPALIACERDRTQIDEQQGVLAFIKNIRFQQNGILVYFQRYYPLPMRFLQENCFALGLDNEWELNRTHWAIKNINLMEGLVDAGFNIFDSAE